jgi:hypothetical protein
MPAHKMSLADHWNKIEKRGPDDCWPWKGNYFKSGYGRATIDRKARLAHRFAWEYANGKNVPGDMFILHACDNKACCNPAHLRPGTRSENAQDALSRGQFCDGSRNSFAKLTEDEVFEIRRKRLVDGVKVLVLAGQYRVSGAVISAIALGQKWKKCLPDHQRRIASLAAVDARRGVKP